MRGSGQRLPITLRFTRVLGTFSHTTCFPFSCALRACFSDRSVSGERSEPIGALMSHAALWVVQRLVGNGLLLYLHCFNAARGCFLSPPPPLRGPPPPLTQGRLGYAPFSRRITQYQLPSPMRRKWRAQRADGGAHAARGFVSGAAWNVFVRAVADRTFQCRTRLCGWCSNEDKRRFF